MAYFDQHQSKSEPTKRPTLRLPRLPDRLELRLPVTRRVLPAFHHTRYLHPDTGTEHFGFVPPIAGLKHAEDYAPIILTHGWQSTSHSGMGACHVWHRHSEQIAQHGAQDIACFVANVIQQGTPIFRLPSEHCEPRIGVYRQRSGLVVLGPNRQGNRWRWVVITAYKPGYFDSQNPLAYVEIALKVSA